MLDYSEFPSVLVTGATGCVGQAMIAKLCELGVTKIVCTSRTKLISERKNLSFFQCGDANDCRDALTGCEVVVHLAARVLVMQETTTNPLAEFLRVNVQGTVSLARQAAAAGVTRFVFVSSIKVNGESKQLGAPFQADDVPARLDTYGVPLPLGAIHNQRSLVALDNLVDLIVTCLTHLAAANQTFLVSDGEDVSTTGLLRRMGPAMGRRARLILVPGSWLSLDEGLRWAAGNTGLLSLARNYGRSF